MNRKGKSHVLTPKKPSIKKPSSLEKNHAQRIATFLKRARKHGIKPVDEKALDAMGDVWPEEENIDEFIAWLRRSRMEGRY